LFGGVGGAQSSGGEFIEDTLATFRFAWVFAGFKTERDEDFVQSPDNRWVRNTEFFLDIFYLAAGPEEGLDEGQLFTAEFGKRASIEPAIDTDSAGWAFQPTDNQCTFAAGAGTHESGHSVSSCLSRRVEAREAVFDDVGIRAASPAFDGGGAAADAGGECTDDSGGGRCIPVVVGRCRGQAAFDEVPVVHLDELQIRVQVLTPESSLAGCLPDVWIVGHELKKVNTNLKKIKHDV
jgi:hypothetical protein